MGEVILVQLTFILGNGFDTAIGMKTRYWDFYQWYVNQPDESTDDALIKKEISKYLDGENSTWADFEIALGQFTNVITDKMRFIEVFQHARDSLIRYLSSEYKKRTAENADFLKSATYCLIDLSQKITNDLPENQKSLFSVSKETKTTFNCISFNYTPVLRDGAQEMRNNAGGISNNNGWWGTYEIGRTLNVHGQLDDYPILGVDNPSQIANESFRNDPDILQLMVKGEIDARLGRNWRKDAREIIADSDKIYVYGASLGDTDEYWWKALAGWFELNLEDHQLALYCHPDVTDTELKQKQELFVRNISKHFTKGEYSANIAVDSVIKSMTLGFARACVNSKISLGCKAQIKAVPASEIKTYL